jgi:hypothetical protein
MVPGRSDSTGYHEPLSEAPITGGPGQPVGPRLREAATVAPREFRYAMGFS